MQEEQAHPDAEEDAARGEEDRQGVFSKTNTLLMAAGLAAGYGTFAYMAGRFLYPTASKTRGWMFVCQAAKLEIGESLRYQTPTGEKINVARVDAADDVKSFIALSSTCPHLGCQVLWEANKNRFFCPCHNGIFDPEGKGIGGPPGDAGQNLEQKDLLLKDGLLFMFVETEKLADAGVIRDSDDPCGSGHDPCLTPRDPEIC